MSIGQKARELQTQLANSLDCGDNLDAISKALQFTTTIRKGKRKGQSRKVPIGKTLIDRALTTVAAIDLGADVNAVIDRVISRDGDNAFSQAKQWNAALQRAQIEGMRIPTVSVSTVENIDESSVDALFEGLL